MFVRIMCILVDNYTHLPLDRLQRGVVNAPCDSAPSAPALGPSVRCAACWFENLID